MEMTSLTVSVSSMAEQSVNSWSNISLLLKPISLYLSTYLMSLRICSLVLSMVAQCNKKWVKVSAPVLHSRHVGSTSFWLKEALFDCKMYVPVTILRCTAKRGTSRRLPADIIKGCRVLLGFLAHVNHLRHGYTGTTDVNDHSSNC